ncbi:MAG: PHP domain-containing protein [Erysipelotrichaceae bacterium]
MKADLHIHSEHSFDATESVESIVASAKQAGLDVIALCDHNATQGALTALKQQEVQVISGIEIDCTHEAGILHVLGYGCDLTHPDFEALQRHYKQALQAVKTTRLQLLEQLYDQNMDEATIIAYTGVKDLTNVEMIRYLLAVGTHPALHPYQKGVRKDNPIANFFWDQMDVGKPAYVKMGLPTFEATCQLIRKHGGIVVLAHPKMNVKTTAQLKALVPFIDGVEVFCSYHNAQEAAYYAQFAKQHQLLVTMGSDYHGINKPNIALGQTGFEEDASAMIADLRKAIEQAQAHKQREG